MSPQKIIGHYRITGKLGEGGMGVVYRAMDTRLNREVAIKVLPAGVADDPDRMRRFEREARVLASLDHPNIGSIHGIEQSSAVSALVLALIEGPTLADRIAGGPIPVDEAIEIARQLAEALEYAHERGIVHRDLKPVNIKITPEGAVKVLDFGLARALTNGTGAPVSGDPSVSPTVSMRATQAGVILGTAAYMAPEQAKGKTADRRADIWSFGVIFLEMLTGRRAFRGESVAEILAAVMKDAPPLERLPAETPPAVRRLIGRCLEKDPRQRLQAIGEARVLLSGPLESATVAPPAAMRTRIRLLPWIVAAALFLGLVLLAWRHFQEQTPPVSLIRFRIPAPDKTTLASYLRLSPDGRQLAFRAADGHVRIWVRSLDSLESHALAGTEGADSFFWSPDSRYIAFSTDRKLKKVEASGGPVQTLADLPQLPFFLGGAWSPSGVMVVSMVGQGLMRIPETGGALAPVTVPGREHPTFSLSPSFLPDGRHFVYEFCPDPPSQCGIYVRSLDAKPEERNTAPIVAASFATHPSDTAVAYAPTPDANFGYVLFERDGSLMALPFDARRLRPAGEPVFVAQGIGTRARSFSASAGGVLAFRQDNSTLPKRSLLWFDRHGKQLGQVGPPGLWGNVAVSPDGKFATVDSIGQSGSLEHVWIIDTARGVPTRLNRGEEIDYGGHAISPDGRVAFTYNKGGVHGDIFVKQAYSSGEAQPLVVSENMKHSNDWSRDGRFVLYDEHPGSSTNLWVVPVAGDRKPIPFLARTGEGARFSPDGHWVAYTSAESGRLEVYVQGFLPDRTPAAGVGKWQVSTEGGSNPHWGRDGREIYYMALDRKIMAAPVTSTATTFQPGMAVPLFQTRDRHGGFAVAPDGRFLLDIQTEETPPNTAPITVVVNWWAALKR